MSFRVELDIEAQVGGARAGIAHLPTGPVPTPCFMPVGTRGAVKHLSAVDLEALGARIVLGNTYHLMLRPGPEVIAQMGGLNRFTSWSGASLTDSGGYQVFSLGPKVDDDGVTFRSVYDGSIHRFTPERAVAVQEAIGADVQMVLDVCPPLPSAPEVVRVAVDRTAAWAERARAAHRRDDQAQFGIVQGGLDEELRRRSARHLAGLGFSGYAVGGLSVGETRAEMLPALAAALEGLPADQPRYLMGVGDPASIVEAVALGIDLFDCVLPTRLGRHGTALTTAGRVNLKAAVNTASLDPIDPTCPCAVCARHPRGYLRHLLAQDEPTAGRLVTWHNLAWLLALVARVRASIVDGTFATERASVLGTWG